MTLVYSLVFAACFAGADQQEDCAMGSAPFWFQSVGECEEFKVNEYQDYLKTNNFKEVLSTCVPVTLPLVESDTKPNL